MHLEFRQQLDQQLQLDPRIEVVGKLVFGTLIGWWAGLHWTYQALIVLIVVDMVTGVVASLVVGRKLDSSISWRGILKKAMEMLSVGLAAFLEPNAGGVPLGPMVAGYWLAHEGLSVAENYAIAGLPLPRALRDVLAKMASESPKPPPPGVPA